MLVVGLVYAGLITALLGAASLVKPLAFLGIRSRPRGALVLGIGLIVAATGAFLPAGETRVAAIQTRLDEFAPVYQFNEVHRIQVRASRNHIYRAIQEVTANEILLFRTLTWLRRLGQPGPDNRDPGVRDGCLGASQVCRLLASDLPRQCTDSADVVAGYQAAGGSGGFAMSPGWELPRHSHFLATK